VLRRALSAIDAVCLGAANLAALLVVCIALLAIIEILLRAVFNFGLSFALEYESYALCLVMFAGSGWALRQGAHVRVNLLTNLLPPAGRRIADIVATAFSLGVSGYVSVALVNYALTTFQRGTVSIQISQTPLAYPQALFALSACVLTLAVAARLARLLLHEAPEATEDSAAEGRL
jgi:TRAP-type C4-dicarboxylate transport system permease small subunit